MLRCYFFHNIIVFVHHVSSYSQFLSYIYLFLLQGKYHPGNEVRCFFMAEITVCKEEKKICLICGKVSTAERLASLFF